MKLKEIREILIEKVILNQSHNGIRGSNVASLTKPFKDLEKFDSMTALEVLVEVEFTLEDYYGIEVELDISVFKEFDRISDNCDHKNVADITIEEVSTNILKRIK